MQTIRLMTVGHQKPNGAVAMLQKDGLDRLRARGGQSASVADQLVVAHKHHQPAGDS